MFVEFGCNRISFMVVYNEIINTTGVKFSASSFHRFG